MNNTIKSTLILTLTAFIWGMGFVAQRAGMEHVGPFLFSGLRMLLGAATLLLVARIGNARTNGKARKLRDAAASDRKDKRESLPLSQTEEGTPEAERIPKPPMKYVLKGGIVCGLILFVAGNFQQVGLVVTTASKAGFLTALYIILVPILGIFLKHKTHWNTWVSVAVAAMGLYFLCITADLSFQVSDFIVLIGAMFWAVHILAVDKYVPALSQSDVMMLCVFQFATSGVCSMICSLLFDGFFVSGGFNLSGIVSILPAILYAGILSTGAGFTLQAVGQKYANPSAASIIMSLEAVFSVVGGFLILHERLTGREGLGCALMFAAVLLAQLPVKSRK
ncbi:MAG: DMT family transporter [Clostridiales Family XIII bacterium]|jgi:drug/metabolite transporter (DMT)-like permease|nr:DMT family transporter [Clostridiales Family XIII bacterium]